MGSPVIPPPPDYTGVPSPPDAGSTPINPYAGPAIQGADDPGKLGRILNFALQNREAGMLSPQARIGLVVPGASSLLGRVMMQGGAQGAGSLARGEGPTQVAKEAAIGGGSQLVGEGLLRYPAKLGMNSAVMAQTEKDIAEKGAQVAAGNTFNKSMADAVNTLNTQGYKAEIQKARDSFAEQLRQERGSYKTSKQQVELSHQAAVKAQDEAHQAELSAFGEKAVADLMDRYKSKVPALESFPSDTRGYLDAVYGKGPDLVSKEFDAAMKAAKADAQRKTLTIPQDVAEAMGIKAAKVESGIQTSNMGAGARSPAGADFLRMLTGGEGNVKVNAADAIDAMVGKSTKNRKAYHALADALSEAGLGTEEARAMYKSFRALADYTNKVKGLSGEQVNPENFIKGFTDRSTVDILRNRGEGNIFEGPFQAMRGAPQAPPPIPKPVIPPFIPPMRPQMPQAPSPVYAPQAQAPQFPADQFTVRQNPLAGHPWYGAGFGAGLGGMLGLGYSHLGVGGLAGMLASQSMPKQFVTRAPLTPEQLTRLNALSNTMPSLIEELRARLTST